MSGVVCRALRHRYDGVPAISGVDLDAPAGRLTAVLGPSGCGKTTLLRSIAGFERPESGRIVLGERTVLDDGTFVPPERRSVGMVFQDHALFPHLTVAANVGYGLGRRPPADRVAEMLRAVGLEAYAERRPAELSGGQQQRVALARAIAPHPELLLLDEPFSSVDARLRSALRDELRTLLVDRGLTSILVTHDQEEALALADHVVLLRAGVVVQAGAPEELYERPVSRWAAELLGPVEVLEGLADRGVVETPLGTVAASRELRGAVDVLLRPEHVEVVDPATDDRARPVLVTARQYLGATHLLALRTDRGEVVHAVGPAGERWRPGDRPGARIVGAPQVLARRAHG